MIDYWEFESTLLPLNALFYKGSESRDSPYYEPLTAASGDDSGDGASRRLPIRILMDGEAGVSLVDD